MESILGALAGRSSPAALRALRAVLDRGGYERTLVIPAYRSHERYPFQDLVVYWRFYVRRRSEAFLVAYDPTAFHGAFRRRYPEAWILYTLFYLILPVPEEELKTVMSGEELQLLAGDGFLCRHEASWRSLVTVSPFDGRYFICSTFYDPPSSHVFLGADSMILSLYMKRELKGRAFEEGLDLCTGSGIQAHTLGAFCRQVTGVDINPRAVGAAKSNALLNGREMTFLQSDLYGALEGRSFDVIASNPPYVMLPESLQDVRYAYGGEDYGLEIPLIILKGLDEHLRSPGVFFMVTFSPVVKGEDLLRRRLAELFSAKEYAVTYWITETFAPDRDVEFYAGHGLSAFHLCLVKIEKGRPFSLRARGPDIALRLCQWKLPFSRGGDNRRKKEVVARA